MTPKNKPLTHHLVWRMLAVTVVSTITPFAKHKLIWISSLSAYLRTAEVIKCKSNDKVLKTFYVSRKLPPQGNYAEHK
jgi:hypothetical protein